MPGQAVLKRFVVIEGLDGSGTTTQLENLKKRCKDLPMNCRFTHEPTAGPIGKLIRHVLKGKEKIDPATLALLFAADRNEHIYNPFQGIKKQVSQGELVICDRYLFSSLAYQSLELGYEPVWELNKHFPLPEHLLFLDVPVEICQQRMLHRDEQEIFEEISLQRRVGELYEKAFRTLSHPEMRFHRVDGTQGAAKITEKILSIIRTIR